MHKKNTVCLATGSIMIENNPCTQRNFFPITQNFDRNQPASVKSVSILFFFFRYLRPLFTEHDSCDEKVCLEGEKLYILWNFRPSARRLFLAVSS